MASSFFALFDDIAAIMDDVAAMTKVATKKTAGVVGDDLALNANMLTGLNANRELPVIWAVTKGSLVNKAILVPLALLLSAFLPGAVGYVLMIGGAYLCYEGVEKVIHAFFHRQQESARQLERKQANAENLDLVALEKDKIRDAVRTDFILSAEIVVIALGVLVERGMPIASQIITLSIIALLVTFMVYGVVAIIVKLDDIGLYWREKHDGILDLLGRAMLWFAPKMLKALSVIGTLAMFVVGGHIWVEHIPALHHGIASLLGTLPGWLSVIVSYLCDIAVGIVVGLATFAILAPLQKLFGNKTVHQ
ncbi:MAG: DUF808 domain-containing protein [Cardiobacteriaceae bacterium]|nr:DUF808 domain-containing protein [Cardiobacteriaceae bacterium]